MISGASASPIRRTVGFVAWLGYGGVIFFGAVMLGGMGEGSSIPVAWFGAPISLVLNSPFATLITWMTFGYLAWLRMSRRGAERWLWAHYVVGIVAVLLARPRTESKMGDVALLWRNPDEHWIVILAAVFYLLGQVGAWRLVRRIPKTTNE